MIKEEQRLNKFSTYKPELMGLLVASITLFTWYLSSLAIEHRVIPKSWDSILSFLNVLIPSGFGACAGAWAAFSLNTKKEINKENLERVRSLNSALFISSRQINTIAQLRKSILSYQKDPYAGINLQPEYIVKNELLRIDFSKLEFLIEKGAVDVLDKLALEEDRFLAAIESVATRTAFHYEILQPALENSDLPINIDNEEQIKHDIGERLFFTSINLFTNLSAHVLETYESYIDIHKELFDKSKSLYPENTFIHLSFPKE